VGIRTRPAPWPTRDGDSPAPLHDRLNRQCGQLSCVWQCDVVPAADDHRRWILDSLRTTDDHTVGVDRLCQMCVAVTDTMGAGISLMTGDVTLGSIGTTNSVSARLEQFQYTFGEGPCVDAHREGRPVSEPDLAAPVLSDWSAFTPAAVESGARAVFGFPIAIGTVRLGALTLYRDRPGPLSPTQHTDALLFADTAAEAIIEMQAAAPPGALGAEVEAGTNFRFVVHQAAGMVSVQIDNTVAAALIRLRAHAFATGRLLSDVAEDVVARRLRFEERDTPE
jgi:hypothetical protein